MKSIGSAASTFAAAVVLQLTLGIFTTAAAAGPADQDPALAPARLVPQAAHGVLLDGANAGDRIVAVGEHGVILVSEDRGGTWRQAQAPVQVTLTGVAFEDGAHGWAVGHDATILYTEDGGDSWTIQHFDPELDSPLLDVWFDGPARGIAVGANGALLSTKNGGREWRKVVLSLPDGFRPHLFKVAGSRRALYVAAEEGALFTSTDMGESWSQLESPYEGSFFGIAEVPGGSQAPVIAYGMLGHIFFSEDGVSKWLEIATDAQESLLDHGRMQDGAIVLVGRGGRVLVSHDRGRSFQRVNAGTTMDIAAVVAIPGQPDSALLLGSRGVAPLRIPPVPGSRSGAP